MTTHVQPDGKVTTAATDNVARYNGYQIMMTLDGHPLGDPDPTGAYVLHSDHATRLAEVEAERDRQYDENVNRIYQERQQELRAEAAEARVEEMLTLVRVAGEARLLIDTGFSSMGETVNYPLSLIAKVCEMLEPHAALQGEKP